MCNFCFFTLNNSHLKKIPTQYRHRSTRLFMITEVQHFECEVENRMQCSDADCAEYTAVQLSHRRCHLLAKKGFHLTRLSPSNILPYADEVDNHAQNHNVEIYVS